MDEKKILKNYISYFLVGLLICLVGMTNVFADTSIDTADWINVTGIKYSETGLFYTGNPTFNNDWLLNNYYVSSGTYVNNGADWNYVEFSYFEHSGGTFNPCNSTSKFTANFSLLFTAPYLVDQVTQVKWGNDNCAMTSRNNQSGLIELACGASPSTGQQTDIFIYYSDSIFQQNQGYVYISRDIDISCGLNTDAIINNDNANTQNIINNNNQNTQDIINNQNQNTQDMIDSQKVCTNYDKNSIKFNGYIDYQGNLVTDNNYGATDFIKIDKNTKITVLQTLSWHHTTNVCFYNTNKSKLSCIANDNLTQNQVLTIPDNANYVRFSIEKSANKPQFSICKNGSQALDDSINDLDNTLNDSDIDNSDAVDFFSNFNDNTHGLSGIISAPLVAINSMLDNQCSPQTATWKGQTISIDCGYDFWNRLSTFKQFLNIALDGLICYRILIKLFKLIENIKNPEDDRVEVMDL